MCKVANAVMWLSSLIDRCIALECFLDDIHLDLFREFPDSDELTDFIVFSFEEGRSYPDVRKAFHEKN